ncbi:MAG: UDP-2,4-diacetamido-2,4,6-trideoxy-beta-L-altropyranose hydrolase [Lachnospiraceae bacterium]|nr:UDP-2,4-diacetamido-2,4,6-trideoxy-beta-L-altropyranose hydrolase [Lachnospiraceae bacterium]
MFYIRADGNTKIGAGHIMRCISIAEALKNRGKVTIFITADEESAKLISSKGFGVLNLKTKYYDMDGELEMLLPVLKDNDIETLLIDSYSVTTNYMQQVGKRVKTIYMDDLGETIYPVDMLINYNIYAPEIGYEEKYKFRLMKVPQLLIGCEYAPLRVEFQTIDTKVRRMAKDVLITTGGSDPQNIAGKLLEVLRDAGMKYRGIQFHVVSGAFNKNIEKLRELERENTNFHVYQNVRHMAELMKKCDVAIAACGSTMYELSSMGIPTVCYFFADNQKMVAESFGKSVALNAGDISSDESGTIERILGYLDSYLDSYDMRNTACEKMVQLLDGDGASRIADRLIQLERSRDDKMELRID